jgi:hypothetical protein
VTIAVAVYAVVVVCLWLFVELLTDRAWPATLVAFGPRWPAAIPLVPLAILVTFVASGRRGAGLTLLLGLTGVVLVVGFMDFRLGLERAPANPINRIRIMTYNMGESGVTAEAVDRLLRTESVDVAALQECPFSDYSPARLGWRFFYGGDLCLVSRYSFSVLDLTDPDNAWRRHTREPLRFTIDGPTGRFQLLNVHLDTIRGGVDALGAHGWRGLPQFAFNRDEARVESETARERSNISTEPLIVAGDFNLPVESSIYRASWGDLTNVFSACGRGFGHTKFTGWFGIRIDHVLTSKHWDCMDARVLAISSGSDHAPLVVDLRLR